MPAQVISLSMRRPFAPDAPRDWSQREIAEFYRVESALVQAGMRLESERGISDEGDPWFAFCHADTGEVFIHFAREDGRYVVDGGPFGAAARGSDFAALVRELIGRHPLAATRRPGSNVMLHPAALLIALVGACFFHAVQAKAAETSEGVAVKAAIEHARRSAITLANGDAPPVSVEAGGPAVVALDAVQAATLLAAIAIGLREPATAASPASATVVAPIGAATPDFLPLAGRQTVADAARAADAAYSHAEQSAAALSVVAVLHDLFRIQTAAASPVAAAPVATVGPSAVSAATAAESSAPVAPAVAASEHTASPALADRALLVVHLSAGELPHLEAVAIVQGLGVLKLLSLDHIDRVDHLPGYILNAIAQGEQVDMTHADALAAPAPTPTIPDTLDHSGPGAVLGHVDLTPTAKADDHGGGGGSGGGGGGDTPAGSSGGDPPASGGAPPPAGPDLAVSHTDAAPTPPPASATVAPVDPTPIAAPVTTPPATTAAVPAPTAPASPGDASNVFVQADSDTIHAAVLKFATDVHAGVLLTDGKVLIYDPRVLDPLPVTEHLDGITFHFSDGSSISLVGTTTSLHDLHGLH